MARREQSSYYRQSATNFDQTENVVLVIGIHQGEVRSLDSTLTQHGILDCDRFVMPLLVTLPGEG